MFHLGEIEAQALLVYVNDPLIQEHIRDDNLSRSDRAICEDRLLQIIAMEKFMMGQHLLPKGIQRFAHDTKVIMTYKRINWLNTIRDHLYWGGTPPTPEWPGGYLQRSIVDDRGRIVPQTRRRA